MSQQTIRPGPRAGATQRRRGRGQGAPAVSRSLYLEHGTNQQIIALAQRLGWTESRTLNRLVQLGLLPYRSDGTLDVEPLSRRLVEVEMELELERVGTQEG